MKEKLVYKPDNGISRNFSSNFGTANLRAKGFGNFHGCGDAAVLCRDHNYQLLVSRSLEPANGQFAIVPATPSRLSILLETRVPFRYPGTMEQLGH
jgi:hypothetical protein